MNLSIIKKLSLLAIGILLTQTACFNDLDTIPIDEDIVTSAVVYDDPNTYQAVLAKLYAGLAVSGQEGPSGQSDIAGIDEGFGQYLRGYWYHQEFPTEEAVVGWNDQTIKDFHEQDWDAKDGFINAFYSRIFYQISLTNEFLRETTEEKLNERGVDAGLKADIQLFRAEARFLRALSYYHALDLFRNIPFVTEEDQVGAFFPEQNNAQATFDYIESELKAIDSELLAPMTNAYGRADKAAAWAVLAKLYLNAAVYIGQNKYTECIEYCNQIINAGYSLEPEYQHLFLADNHNSNEIIFPVTFDGINTRTWGGMTFIIRAGIGGDMIATDFGVESGWGGTRTTSGLVDKFTSQAATTVEVVSPNFVTPNYPRIYVPGAYQNWNPASADNIWSPSRDGNFVGYFNFIRGTEIRFTPQPNWNTVFGDNEGDGILDPNGGNIDIPAAGFYRISLNVNNLTYDIEPITYGIIGAATGGADTTDLTYNAIEQFWEYTGNLAVGNLQFAARNGLDLLGDAGNALLSSDGNPITIDEAGNYTVRLYLNRPDVTYAISRPSSDSRQIFFTEGQSLDIFDISQFQEGYAVVKFQNITSTGENGSDMGFPDTDFPMYRLADIYLMYAEAVLRGGSGGDQATALEYVNQVRTRAFKDPSGNITAGELNLDFILDERARELYWECHRRTDLVRFGQFSNGSYVWPWKGGTPDGRPVDAKFDIYPIPSADIGSNPNLTQNPGY